MGKEQRLYNSILAAERHGSPISVAFYRQWLSDSVEDNPSTNHWTLAACAELLNHANHHPKVWGSADAIAAAWQVFFGGPFMAKEQHTRNVYLVWIGHPARIAADTLYRMGRTAQGDIGAAWVKAFCGFLILSAWKTKPPGISVAEHEKDGPACITAAISPVSSMVRYTSVLAGKRSAVKRSDGHWRHWDVSAANEVVQEIFETDVWLSPEEKDVANRALLNEMEALLEVARWTDITPPRNPYRVIRTTEGVAWFMLRAGGGSTASLYGCSLDVEARTQKFLVADPGGRDSGGGDDDVEAGECVIEGWVATAQRLSKNLPSASMALPRGRVMFDMHYDGQGDTTIWVPIPPPVEPPVPPVEPPPEKPSLLQRIWAWLKGLFD